MTTESKHALELRVARARTRLERRVDKIEARGREMLRGVERAATVAALVAAGIGGAALLAAFQLLSRKTKRRRHAATGRDSAGRISAPWLMVAAALAVAGARRMLGAAPLRRLPLALPSATRPPHVDVNATLRANMIAPRSPKS